MINDYQMMDKRHFWIWGLLWFAVWAASCSGGDDSVVALAEDDTQELTLYLRLPQQVRLKAGDPGEATGEDTPDWDRLALMWVYTNERGTPLPTRAVFLRTLTLEEYDALPEEGGLRRLSINVQRGDAYVYGVTYSSDEVLSPEADIRDAMQEGSGAKQAVERLTISNAYASGNRARFLSVATGYYKGDGGRQAVLPIGSKSDGAVGQVVPTMELTRLAAKLDIQWDAQDAYTAGYTDVKVESFACEGGVVGLLDGDPGAGRLFPGLQPVTAEPLGGRVEFLNTVPVSQRNGRVYHYLYPDGTASDKVTFRITARTADDGGEATGDYTISFSSPLRQAAWYKVNATIKGIQGDGTITVGSDS